MIRVFGCETARELLPAFVDGELDVAAQVEIEVHLRSCRTCAAHVEDLRLIGDALRLRGAVCDDAAELGGLQAGVLSRVRAEQEQSYTTRARRMFDDLHVFWAAIGATAGVMACILLTLGVTSAVDARAVDSLAATIDALGNPGSDQNPVLLDGRMSPPRLAIPNYFDDSPELTRIPKNDAVFALSAVVTRDGRIADYELLLSHYPASDEGTGVSRQHGDTPPTHAEMSRFRDALSTLRFAPAQAGGSPVAVNIVWLFARTTVKGSPRPFDFDEFRPRTTRTRRVG